MKTNKSKVYKKLSHLVKDAVSNAFKRSNERKAYWDKKIKECK